MKKITSLTMCICMIVSMLMCTMVLADNSCGENANWTINNGVLTISGTGKMDDYNFETEVPWYTVRESISKIVIENGITHIGDLSFYGCINAEVAEISETVESVGISAFSYTEGSQTNVSNIGADYGFELACDVDHVKKDDVFYMTITLSGNLKNLSVLQSMLVYDKERISFDQEDWCDEEWYNTIDESNLGYLGKPLSVGVTNTVRIAYISLNGDIIDEGSPLYDAGETTVTVAKIKFTALTDIASMDMSCFYLKDCALIIDDGEEIIPKSSITQLTSATILPLANLTIIPKSSAVTEFAKNNGISFIASSDAAVNDKVENLIDDTADEITVYIDGEKIEFDVKPILYEDKRTLVPLRAIFEKLGAVVTWDDETQTAMAIKGNKYLCCQIDNTIMPTSKGNLELDVPAKLIDDRTLVPIRAISESFDYKVDWIEKTQQVIITTNTDN